MQFVVHKEAKSNMCSVAMLILVRKPLVEQYDFRALVLSQNIIIAFRLQNIQIFLVYEKWGLEKTCILKL